MKEKTFNDFWEELKAESPETREFCQKIDDEIEFCEMCAGRVKALMDRDKWIDVNDRLPDTIRDVIMYTEWGDMCYGWYNQELQVWNELYGTVIWPVTYWRELPDPPRMEGEI